MSIGILVVAAIIALVLGVIAEIEAQGRNWAGWGVVALAVGILLEAAT
jgi:hypothetical protein